MQRNVGNATFFPRFTKSLRENSVPQRNVPQAEFRFQKVLRINLQRTAPKRTTSNFSFIKKTLRENSAMQSSQESLLLAAS